MHYLVTGGAGFIGSHLVERLIAGGHRITVLDDLSTGKREHIPAGVKLVVGDITTPHIFDTLVGDLDGCFHLAAIASVERSKLEWLRTHQVNLGGTIALFEALARAEKKIPVVYASSAASYGDCPDNPLSETSMPMPRSSYGADKLACEWHARIASQMFGIPTMGLRFFNVYGPRQDPSSPYSGVISIFAHRMLKGDVVTIYGDGEQQRDFVFVDDVAEALSRAMTSLHHKTMHCGVCNVSTGIGHSVIALAKLMSELTSSTSIITHGPARSGDVRLSIGDPAHARDLIGFNATTSLRSGLSRLLGDKHA
ncbi:MAG: NAD-dependent epimerase/dehydratase family protein [Rickettsiales bacterium]|jgi:UDP-glucose 4-epimerase|nr:NAD-dependent epimerase/dehydratase family protein [Rickettsiales bacterium]